MTSKIVPAISTDALLGKSKLYIKRALNSKASDDLDQYQLWASLAVELLGKSALASVHPSLIVDPNHYQSIFAAAGVKISSDVKTIAAHTLFERLRHIVPKFSDSARKFCEAMALRRNIELHSGEAPFRAMNLDAWESRYWHATQLILEFSDQSLEQWLGADMAKAPKDLLAQARDAEMAAAIVRIEECREAFGKKPKREREELHKIAKEIPEYRKMSLFTFDPDAIWNYICPACKADAVVAGTQLEEDILEQKILHDERLGNLGLHEQVQRSYSAEELHCTACDLHLYTPQELEAAEVETEHDSIEWREIDYEPEYGND
jgi:hypothetical protein